MSMNGVLMFLLCFLWAAFAQDCMENPNKCGVNGQCKGDGYCGCNRGWNGATCSLGPPILRSGWTVPGKIDANNRELFFAIAGGDFDLDQTLTLTTVPNDPFLEVYASVGRVPSVRSHQMVAAPPAGQTRVLTINSRDPDGSPVEIGLSGGNATSLYILVTFPAESGPASDAQFASFTLEFDGSLTTIAGLRILEFGLAVGGGACCCCIILLVLIVFFFMWNRKRKRTRRRDNPFLAGDDDAYSSDGRRRDGYPAGDLETNSTNSIMMGHMDTGGGGGGGDMSMVQAGYGGGHAQAQQQQQQQQMMMNNTMQSMGMFGGGTVQAGYGMGTGGGGGSMMQPGYAGSTVQPGYAGASGGGSGMWGGYNNNGTADPYAGGYSSNAGGGYQMPTSGSTQTEFAAGGMQPMW